MKDGFVKVAAVTPKIKVADVKYNTSEIIRLMKEADDNGAKVIVFPELCITGYTCNDLFLQGIMLNKVKTAIQKITLASADMDSVVYIGAPLMKDGKLYNIAAVIKSGELLAFIPKKYIPNYGEFYEIRQFCGYDRENSTVEFDGKTIPFGRNIIISTEQAGGIKIAAEICEDLWTVDPPSTSHALHGANLIVNLSASNEIVGKDTYRKSLVSATSARLVCGYIYSSAGDGESTQDIVFSGHNIIAENGSVLNESKPLSGTDVIYSEIDFDLITGERRRMNTFEQLDGTGYEEIKIRFNKNSTDLTRKYPMTPFVPANSQERDYRCDQILSIQACGLKKRLEHTNSATCVVGISGGLDSTLALLVIAKAYDMLGKDRKDIISVTMPCFGTTDRTYQNACELTRKLGATLREIRIEDAVRQHFKDIGHDESNHNVVYENGQARERTQILMDIANQTNGLVIGTGDMSELALGWATYNGDHMSMYGVNVGVPKTLVRYLVDYYAKTCGDDELRAVLEDVLATPVSPELLPPENGQISQKTEDLVGPYELHDFVLYYMLRRGFSPKKIFRLETRAFEGVYDKETILKWEKIFYRRFFSQHFKRSCLPDGPKVGSAAVSPRGDLRMPSDAVSALWLEELDDIEL